MSTMALGDVDDVRLARGAGGLLRTFNEAGVLTAADVRVALRLGALAGTADEPTLLAAALAVRGPRLGHVCVDLTTIRTTVTTDADDPVDLAALPWPDDPDWLQTVRTSPLVGDGCPLRLEGPMLYLDRYWSDECQVAAGLLAKAAEAPDAIDLDVLRTGLDAVFPAEGPDLQRLAAASAVLRRFSLIAGGPGTGKTTTVARVLALLDQQAESAGARSPLVALAAPTGKAAARLEEAVHEEASRLPIPPEQRDRQLALQGMTLHRLLGWTPNPTRFRHHRLNRLAHDVVVVDESSMVSLSLMGRLVEAVRADARLILVGDPEQLASVEAGAVLGDIAGPATQGLRMRERARQTLARATGQEVEATDPPGESPVGDGIVVLRRVHRFGGTIARFAGAVQQGDGDAAVGLLQENQPDVIWIKEDVTMGTRHLGPVHEAAVTAGRRVIEAAREGRATDAISALASFRLLCAHRRGPAGATTWMLKVEAWLAAAIGDFATGGDWYPGRPLLVTENDYSLRLYNGDIGVVITGPDGRPVAVFERGGEVMEVSPSRLESVDTVYAMTVHKAQGSQFENVAVLLPPPDSPVLTRELLYTAVTRARRQVILAGTEESIRSAIERPIARGSGLRRRLWGT